MNKSLLRKEYLTNRKNLSSDFVLSSSRSICQSFLNSEIYENSSSVMLYSSILNEPYTEEIKNAALIDRKNVFYPKTDAETVKITPIKINKNSIFAKGAFNVYEPTGTVCDDIDFYFSNTDVIIIPGILFDLQGHRIGFGKGCYDRFLTNTDALRVAFCYSFQIKDSIPYNKHDVGIDILISEKGIIYTSTDI